jgi:menaquinone-9 beta-reductase
MKKDWEALVVGAGPAGCSAAMHLHSSGIEVLLIDKALFPRDKVCGDGIPRKCFPLLEELGVPVALVQTQGYPVDCLHIHGPGGERVAYGSADDFAVSKGVCWARRDFDHVLQQQAQRRLKHVELGEQAVALSRSPDGRQEVVLKNVVTGATRTIRARLVIGADGARSAVARCAGAPGAAAAGNLFGLRMYCEGANIEKVMHIVYDRETLPGYVWLFPVSHTRANIGMLVTSDILARHGSRMAGFFRDTVARQEAFGGLQPAPDRGDAVKGFPLPAGPARSTRVRDGVLLAGDAGAFVNPLTGGGIFNALASGKLAARVGAGCLKRNDCSAAALREYDVGWSRLLGSSFYYSGLLMRLLARPRAASRILRCCAASRVCAHLFMAVYGNPLPRFGLLSPLLWLHVLRR